MSFMFMKGANTSLYRCTPITWNSDKQKCMEREKKEKEAECDKALIKYEYQ